MNIIEPITYQSLSVNDVDELNFETYKSEVEQLELNNLESEEVVEGMVEQMVIIETTKQMKRMQESLKEALEDV